MSRMPASNTHCIHLEEKLTTGTNLDRMVKKAYALACCTACPHSWAATAAAAMLLLWYTWSLRLTTLVAGL